MAFPLRDIYTTPADLSGIFTCNLDPNFKQLSVCVFQNHVSKSICSGKFCAGPCFT